MRVLVLGGAGMLGSMVVRVFMNEPSFEICATSRRNSTDYLPAQIVTLELDANDATVPELEKLLAGFDWAINCIGVIKNHIHDDNSLEVERAIKINGLFPHHLAKAAKLVGCKVIQIATDCIYSGTKGQYVETDVSDPTDVYGKTKSLGEVKFPGLFNLRCSIIGPEVKDRRSLLEWLLNQPKDSKIHGYTNHYWNGITTLHFAKICKGIIERNLPLPNLAHVVPGDAMTKGQLLQVLAKAFGRNDLEICLHPVANPIDRTLNTLNPALNMEIWEAAGYEVQPTLAKMVNELAVFVREGKG